jgi:signal peptidase II
LKLDGTREVRAGKDEDAILGEGDESPPEGGVAGLPADGFQVAEPDAGAPHDREPRRDTDG